MKRALPYLAVAAVFGCGFSAGCGGATTAFTSKGPTLAARPDNCEFSVVAAPPTTPTTELGTIDIKYMKQTDWIYDESAFKRKVRAQTCRAGGDIVRAHINENGLYMSGTVLTTKVSAPVAPPRAPAPSEPEAIVAVAAPVTPPNATSAPERGTQAAAKPEKKADGAKNDEVAKATSGKKRSKKGASAKKDDDIRGKDGKIDINKLL
jgi:hypothetical protein